MANIDICGDDVLYKFDQLRSLQALVLHMAKIGSTDEEKQENTNFSWKSDSFQESILFIYIYN